ncbi:MAG: di-heme-cytochrome C peroxidase [Methylocystis sp.]|uniref:di-heme-cytochrome C peroxidase n=1 Tax=Methylocystis sp. TaxID=1911079 RepID=UPI003DA60202
MSITKTFRFAAALTLVFFAASAPASMALERVEQPSSIPGAGPWDEKAWNDFYRTSQGSRLIPWDWIKALKQADGQPFLADGLARYGYLANPASPTPGLPVGFVVSDGVLGPSCAACHTRQIEVEGKAYRIDGGPALADMGALWADLDTVVGRVLADKASFSEFAKAVLGSGYDPQKETKLRAEVDLWYARHHAITEAGLPKDRPWGAGRIDAVGMILNRVAGLDIGPGPTHIILGNMRKADAPVRPPFLWNAPRQDHTQWPGFADNGDRILAMARNVGQVYGVFGEFFPEKDATHLLGFNYVKANSVDFKGLIDLERLVERIGPPKWPWSVDRTLVAQGKLIYERPYEEGGCADCHGIDRGQPRLLNPDTWCTPVQDVGTDAREYQYFAPDWKVDTGALTGAFIPFVSEPLGRTDAPVSVLATAARGAILQHFLPVTVNGVERKKADVALAILQPLIEELKGVYKIPGTPGAGRWACRRAPETPGKLKFEARVLEGVWAAAPYLHNASVPSLAELLKPPQDRAADFKVGPAYDISAVGLAAEQPKSTFLMKTDCNRGSGVSHCGHDFGTALSAADKRALLEYLKTL